MPTYKMQRTGGCRGAKTGANHTFSEGEEVDAPEGEFSHLPDSAVRVVGYKDRQMKPESGPQYEVREGAGGWHKVYDTRNEEYVDGESSRDKSEAQANADRLNEPN